MSDEDEKKEDKVFSAKTKPEEENKKAWGDYSSASNGDGAQH
jgi:hypothetical protein